MKYVLICAATWINLVMLSGRSETQKAIYCMIPRMQDILKRQIHRDRKQIHGCQGLVRGKMGSDSSVGTEFLCGKII